MYTVFMILLRTPAASHRPVFESSFPRLTVTFVFKATETEIRSAASHRVGGSVV